MASVGSLAFTWTAPPGLLGDKLATWEERIKRGLSELADFFVGAMRSHMRANAPWNDQSGEARAGLDVIATKAAASVVLYLIGRANHTIFLELGTSRMSPRPIIVPTMELFAPQIMARLRALVGG